MKYHELQREKAVIGKQSIKEQLHRPQSISWRIRIQNWKHGRYCFSIEISKGHDLKGELLELYIKVYPYFINWKQHWQKWMWTLM
jgi:hypothetical protein